VVQFSEHETNVGLVESQRSQTHVLRIGHASPEAHTKKFEAGSFSKMNKHGSFFSFFFHQNRLGW
jgi:hypothetical protein